MNETMSLLLATTILALGGLGLYMVKSSDDTQKGGDEEYNEEGVFGSDKSTFGSGSLFNWIGQTENKEEQEQEQEDDEEEEDYKPRKKAVKTQKNRKVSGSSKRRYY
jgi:hypothetical protein